MTLWTTKRKAIYLFYLESSEIDDLSETLDHLLWENGFGRGSIQIT